MLGAPKEIHESPCYVFEIIIINLMVPTIKQCLMSKILLLLMRLFQE